MTTSLQELWGLRIRQLRKERDLSVAKLAKLAEIDRGQLSRIERGLEGIGDERRIRLAAALGQPVGQIFIYPDPSEISRLAEQWSA